MTYKELALAILELNEAQQNQTATIFVPGEDEYYPVYEKFVVTDESCDALDEGHLVLTTE